MTVENIYIVEIPHQRPAHAWVAYGENDFIARVAGEAYLRAIRAAN